MAQRRRAHERRDRRGAALRQRRIPPRKVSTPCASATASAPSRAPRCGCYLLGSPYITQHPDAVTAFENTVATFSVTAGGTGLRYQWLLNGLQIGGADQASYSTPSLTLADSGAVYSVIVYNSAGLDIQPERRAHGAGDGAAHRPAAAGGRGHRGRRVRQPVHGLRRHAALRRADVALVGVHMEPRWRDASRSTTTTRRA